MSKLQLKRELKGMDAEQLRELLLECYSARKEIKEYLDYFVAPDPQALLEKIRPLIIKELGRTKRGGYSKARISFFKKLLRDFDAYQPGWEYQIKARLLIVEKALAAETYINFPDPMINGVSAILNEAIEIGDKNSSFSDTMKQVDALVHNPSKGSRWFRSFLIRNMLAPDASKE